MKKIIKQLAFFAVFAFMLVNVAVLPALAQTAATPQTVNLGLDRAAEIGLTNPGTDADPRDMAVSIVRYLMTFLGIIAVVIILLGGFKWMTAAGNEDKVSEAKKLIIAGIIGLIIILAAFAIVSFVISMTGNALDGDIT